MGWRRTFRRLWRDHRGVTALEFAIVAPLFFMVLLMSVEVTFALLADVTLDSAASRITRMGKIGVFAQEADCQSAVKAEFEKTLGIWADRENVYVNAKLYKPGETITFDDKNGQYDPACNTGDRGDMVVFRLGFDKPGVTGVLALMGLNLFHYERLVVIQNEP